MEVITMSGSSFGGASVIAVQLVDPQRGCGQHSSLPAQILSQFRFLILLAGIGAIYVRNTPK
jgi:hypothetical protein